MTVQIAIVGLAGCGKTTVFNALTRGHVETGGYGGVTVHVGVVKVPDGRLEPLAAIFHPKKIVQATVTFVDLPAPPSPAATRTGAEELPPEQVARLRESEALLHVVRAWDGPAHPHPDGSIDPLRDLERLDLELALADLGVIDRRLERLGTAGRHGTQAEREANEREEAVLVTLKAALEAGRPIRDEELRSDEERATRGFRFLTQKPVLVLANIGEDDLGRAGETVAAIERQYRHRRTLVTALSARLEMELAELEPAEASELMGAYGLAESSAARVVRLSYRLLGLVSFLTAGDEEVRAWPIPDGATALDAAGTVHTDFARGFIRAEVVPFEDLLAAGSKAEARRHGKLRPEGRTYLVRDGDVIEILFSR